VAIGIGQEQRRVEHVLIDEAQDLSPVELAVVFATVSRGQSITLSGDHGVWDGRAAARFLAAVQSELEAIDESPTSAP
jgi:pyruvate/2-oxoglutarate dehydrogenase complex dihydrolipoamide acyltransferase (E2) component